MPIDDSRVNMHTRLTKVDTVMRYAHHCGMSTSILRAKRKERGLTLSNVSCVVGIDNGNLSRIERGIQLPDVRLGKRLAAFFGISLDEVYAEVGGGNTVGLVEKIKANQRNFGELPDGLPDQDKNRGASDTPTERREGA